MPETIIEKVAEAISWVFSGIGNRFLEKILNTSRKNSQIIPPKSTNFLLIPQNYIQPERLKIEEESYSVRLGTRHKFLREKYLKLNPRKMADFYGYTEVDELERYESGKKEFPKKSIEKLKEFFFVNEKFLEEGDSRIFRSFDVNSDELKKLLQNNFKPYFLCSPYQSNNSLYAYTVFCKKEDSFARIVSSKEQVSFLSNGGGYNNYKRIIEEMLRQEMKYHDAFVLKTNKSMWQKLEQGTFYLDHIYFGSGRDYKCADIFYERFHELEDKLYPERYAVLNQFFQSIFN